MNDSYGLLNICLKNLHKFFLKKAFMNSAPDPGKELSGHGRILCCNITDEDSCPSVVHVV